MHWPSTPHVDGLFSALRVESPRIISFEHTVVDERHIVDELRGLLQGGIAVDRPTRQLHATDASPFEIMPLAVARPVDADEVSRIVQFCYEHAIPLMPRGAGTGVAGESLGPGIVIDLSVHLRRILDIAADTVTVESGVVLAELNAALARHGRRFAPDPASALTCTIGGMIATDASGGNAYRHGYTRDYVESLDVVWDTGERDVVSRDCTTRDTIQQERDLARSVALRRATADLLVQHHELIASSSVRTPFNRCGYRLPSIVTDRGIDLTQLLVGSEGTLGIITQATLRTIPVAGGTSVALLGFPTLEAAVRTGLALRKYAPTSADLLDRRLLSLTRHVPSGSSINLIPASVGAALLVTFEGTTEREAQELCWGAIESLRRTHILMVLCEPTVDPVSATRIRGVRESAVAGLYALGKGPRPLAFIEDVGIPTDAMLEFLVRTQDILQTHELTASFLVHTLTGQVHTRPLIDLQSSVDRAKLWPVAEAIHSLAIALGGTISSQHGTGIARTPWVERQVGPWMPLYRELKRIFDPKNILNPGKIVGPDPSRPAWPLRDSAFTADVSSGDVAVEDAGRDGALSESSLPGSVVADRTSLLVWRNTSIVEEANRCSGCGDCRPRLGHDRMCPIFRATGLEEATPRAKANLMRSVSSMEALADDDTRAIVERCVNCKMCRDECHSRVDVPKLMLEAKAAAHAIRGLDRDDWILARVESFAALGSNFAPIVNLTMSNRTMRWLLEKIFGISRRRRLPAFAQRNFFRQARGLGLSRKLAPAARSSQSTRDEPLRVALFVDVFPAYNDPLIAMAAVAVLQHNGVMVHVPVRQVGCGMAPLVVGDVETAREMALQNVRVFAGLIREGFRVVCLEPTSALMLTQDYLDLLDDPDAAVVAAHTTELTTLLWELHRGGRFDTRFRTFDAMLGHHVPCHMKALRKAIAGPELLRLIPGLKVRSIDLSCSGMAGPWGFKAKNFDTSLAAGQPMLRELDRPGILFGSTECGPCRLQMQQGTGKRTLHPVQYLAYAYGLLPDIGNRLISPLNDLVSE